MAGNVSGLHQFQNDTGPVPLALLDQNYNALMVALNTLATFSNFYVDSGTLQNVNVQVPNTQYVSYTDGLQISVRLANPINAGATLNVNNLGPLPILNNDGSAISTIPAAALVSLTYNASRNAWVLPFGGAGGGISPLTWVQPLQMFQFLGLNEQLVWENQYLWTETLQDVSTVPPTNGQVLVYNAASGHYIPSTLGTGGSPMSLAGLTDVVITAPANQQVLTYLNGEWVNQASAGGAVWPPTPPVSVTGPWTITSTGVADQPGLLVNGYATTHDARTCLVCSPAVAPAGAPANTVGFACDIGAQVVPGQWAMAIGGGPTGSGSAAGCSNGFAILAGTNATDSPFWIQNDLGTNTFFQIFGDGHGRLGTNAGGIQWTPAGVYSIYGTGVLPGVSTLAQLTDVNVTGATPYQFLGLLGGVWTNQTIYTETLGDVDYAVPPTNGQVLVYNAATLRYVPTTLAGGGGPTTLAGLTDVTIASPTTGQMLTWNGTHWVNQTYAGGGALPVPLTLTAPASGPSLIVNGAVNSPSIDIIQPAATQAGVWMFSIGGGAASGSPAGMSNGLYVAAGTTASDYALLVRNDSSAATFFEIRGDGSGFLGPSSSVGLQWTSAGAFTAVGGATFPGGGGGGTLTTTLEGMTDVALTLPMTDWNVLGWNGTLGKWTNLRSPPNPFNQFTDPSAFSGGGEWFLQVGAAYPSGIPAGLSNGVFIGAGSNSYDVSFWVCSDGGTQSYFKIVGDGSGTLGPNFQQGMFWDTTGNFRFTLGLAAPGIGTSASAANVYRDANGNLLASTSARRYKTHIHALSVDRARQIVQQVQAVCFRSLCGADDPQLVHYGLIAEEVAEIDPALVTYDRQGKPNGVQYDRVLLMLLPLVQELLA